MGTQGRRAQTSAARPFEQIWWMLIMHEAYASRQAQIFRHDMLMAPHGTFSWGQCR